MANSSDLQHTVDQYLATPTSACREAAVLAGLPLVHSLVGRLRAPNHPLVTQADKNPTWTIMALAMRTSEYITKEVMKRNISTT